MTRVIIAVTNNLANDQRVFRSANTLINDNYNVSLIGRARFNKTPTQYTVPVKLFKFWFNKGVIFYASYNIRLFFFLLFNKYDIVIANDLDTLPAAFFASKIKGKTVVYDSHEHFTQVPELVNRRFQQKVWLWFEKLIIPKLKHAYTVSRSIAIDYEKKYGTKFKVIRNVPYAKNRIDMSYRKDILIYQGALNKGRGIELMIEAMLHMENIKLWIVGKGDVEKQLKKYVDKLNLNNRIKFWGQIPPKDLHKITRKATIGLSLEENIGLSYKYSLPNKLFDYIQARIPVLTSNLPEMKKIMKKYEVGEILNTRTPKNTANVIQKMLLNVEKQKMWRENLDKAAKTLNWENESEILLEIFDSIYL